MKVKASVGNAPLNVDLRDNCYSLDLRATKDDSPDERIETELLARIYYALIRQGTGPLLEQLRKFQKKDKNAPKVGEEIPA